MTPCTPCCTNLRTAPGPARYAPRPNGSPARVIASRCLNSSRPNGSRSSRQDLFEAALLQRPGLDVTGPEAAREAPVVTLGIAHVHVAYVVALVRGRLHVDAGRLHALVHRVDVVDPDDDVLLVRWPALLLPVVGAAAQPQLGVADEHLGLLDDAVLVDVARALLEAERVRQPVERGARVLVHEVWGDSFELHDSSRVCFTYSSN